MSETGDAFRKLRDNYRQLDGPDRFIFWCHTAIAPALILIGLSLAVGFGPASIILGGVALWKVSE